MHTFYPYSECCCRILTSFDYSGILLIICGGYIAILHYEFYCYKTLQIFYFIYLLFLVLISSLLAFDKRTIIRSAGFFLISLSSIIPIVHRRFFLKSENDILLEKVNEQLILICITLGICIFGVFIYVIQIPERFFKECFNILLSSHQIFHLCTVIAAYIFYIALMELFNYYKKHAKCV